MGDLEIFMEKMASGKFSELKHSHILKHEGFRTQYFQNETIYSLNNYRLLKLLELCG